MKEKQKTCITVMKRGIGGGAGGAAITNFSDYITIMHNVDIIRVTSIGGEIYNDAGLGAGPVLVDEAFYITSDLVTNIHDNILGLFGNLSYNFSGSRPKEFLNNNKPISGTYTFYIYQLADGLANSYNSRVSIYINIEFIELEDRNQSISTSHSVGINLDYPFIKK